jgi:hypothetical protein
VAKRCAEDDGHVVDQAGGADLGGDEGTSLPPSVLVQLGQVDGPDDDV